MRKSVAVVVVCLFASAAGAQSQWSGTAGGPIGYNGGYVGVGTTSPTSVLMVQATGPDSVGEKYLTMKNTTSYAGIALVPGQTGDVSWLMMAGFPNAGDYTIREWGVGNRLMIKKTTGYVGINNDSPTAPLDVTGNIHASGNISGGTVTATYQDVAEWVPAAGDLAPGSVVTLQRDAKNTVTASTHAYDTAVAGVVSAQPGVILGVASSTKAKIATTGRVRVRVDATKHAIGVGDLLVTSDKPGVAMVSEPVDLGGVKIHRPGTLIGKALEPLASGEGEILVLLSLQ